MNNLNRIIELQKDLMESLIEALVRLRWIEDRVIQVTHDGLGCEILVEGDAICTLFRADTLAQCIDLAMAAQDSPSLDELGAGTGSCADERRDKALRHLAERGGEMIHIYAPALQPATDWIDTHSGEPLHFGFPPDALLDANCCKKKRMAKDCMVQCCYDGLNIFCAQGKGCKDSAEISEKKAREFSNRSAAQRARWKKNGNKS